MESARRTAPPAPGAREPRAAAGVGAPTCARALRQVTQVEVATGRGQPGSEDRAGGWRGVAGQGREKTEMPEALARNFPKHRGRFSTKERADYSTSIFLKLQASSPHITLKHSVFNLHFSILSILGSQNSGS